ncbi:MAG: hypothetical protein ABEJ30_05730 [Halorientalis sp.]
MPRDFRAEDEGKRVVTADGDTVGMVDRASGTTARIRADQGLSRSIRRRLGWTEEGEETYRLQKSRVDRITDDEIRLKKNL